MNIVTLYNNRVRPDTTGIYVSEALRRLGHTVKHVIPSADGVDGGADMYLLVDDGFDYETDIKPLTYWAIDTHVSYGQQLEKAKQAETVFAAQKEGAARLSKDLGREVKWKPLACDDMLHAYYGNSPKKYDICFVGTCDMNPLFDGRRKFLDRAFQKFPNFYFGQRFFAEAVQKYGESRIVLNYSIGNDVNMRVFEAMASGSLLLTNESDGIRDLFKADKKNTDQLVIYESTADAIDKINYFLVEEGERERIAMNGKIEVLKNHTYMNRFAEV